MPFKGGEKHPFYGKKRPELSKLLHERGVQLAQPDIERKQKRCPSCGKVKPFSEYNKNRGTIRGIQTQCKDCRKIISKISHIRTINKLKQDPFKYRVTMIKASLRVYGIKDVERSFIEKWIKESEICPYCNTAINIDDYSIDHLQPRSRGGPDTFDNLHLVCKSCNVMKGNLTDSEFKELLAFLNDKPSIKAILKQRLKASGFLMNMRRQNRISE